jgi:hypothetical protein
MIIKERYTYCPSTTLRCYSNNTSQQIEKKKIVTDLIIGALGCTIPSNYEFDNENSSSRTNFELQANNFVVFR